MPFFIRNKRKGAATASKTVAKKKLGGKKPINEPANKRKRRTSDDEEIPSDSDIESSEEGAVTAEGKEEHVSSPESDDETAAEKRLRLAKQYLSEIAEEEGDDSSDDDGGDAIGQRLQRELLEESGKLQKDLSKFYLPPSENDIRICRGHKLPVTCIVISPDNKFVFSASKDCSVIKWDLNTGKKVKTIPGGRKGTEDSHTGHTTHVLCLAISSDGKFLVSGDRNKLIKVWDPATCELVHTFKGHRDSVSGLAFRKGSHQLFSGSHDRTVKIWNLDEMAYVETLFGHQDVITAVDSLARERAISCGGRDGSIRIWKVIDESQLVFHGHSGSIDCVSLINEENFVSGAEDNSLALWSVMKKKPLTTVHNAHSGEASDLAVAAKENWVTSVTSLQNTDVIASGSKDGSIRLWKCTKDFKKLVPMFAVPMTGFVNGLKFTSDGRHLVGGLGQEHRLGRWWRIKEARNGICIVKLPRTDNDDAVAEDKSTDISATPR